MLNFCTIYRPYGALPIQSLYLFWDRAQSVPPPTLDPLQHPDELKDLTVYAPPDRFNPNLWRSWGKLVLPSTAHCGNLAYVTYAADRWTIPAVATLCENPQIKAVMFVTVDISEEIMSTAEEEDPMLASSVGRYANFSTAYLPLSGQVLGQWLARIDGRQSVLEHPPPHAVGDDEE